MFFALHRVTSQLSLGTMMPSLRRVSFLTFCCRRMPGQGPAQMLQALGPGSLEALWDLAPEVGPTKPLPHTLVGRQMYTFC